ncbi:MAG: hypothetical protein SFU99_09415 [Saprospiraceae bacterium]|nr:hypothetical protein [Saprospiraceae bacterium]
MKERFIKITIENTSKDASKKHTLEIKNYTGWVVLLIGIILLCVIFKEELFHVLSLWFAK